MSVRERQEIQEVPRRGELMAKKKIELRVVLDSSLVHGAEMTIECKGRVLGRLVLPPLNPMRSDLTARDVRDAMMGVFMTSIRAADDDKTLHTTEE